MATGFSNANDLLAWLSIDPSTITGNLDTSSDFPFKVPLSFASRMERGNPADPLLLQVLPTGLERRHVDGFVTDPVGDLDAVKNPGLIKKYNGRILLIVTAACGVNCRYCFRRHFPYSDQRLDRILSTEAMQALGEDDIEEVILSGGDPLTLNDKRLISLLEQLAGLANIRRLRIHTRMPTLLPDRVTATLVDYLGEYRLPVTIVLHANHANEYNQETDRACQLLRDKGVHLLNQAVLLKGINDNVGTLERLCTRGFEVGILPYYVHQLDKVEGSAHFAVDLDEAITLESALRERLPGYLLPRFVTEIAGKKSKIPI